MPHLDAARSPLLVYEGYGVWFDILAGFVTFSDGPLVALATK